MLNWRKWLPWVALAIFVVVILLHDHIAAAVAHAVGMTAIRTHPVLTVVCSIGIGVVISLITTLIMTLTSTRKTNLSVAISFIFAGGVLLVQMCFETHSFYSGLHTANLIDNINRLFINGCTFSFFLLQGLLQLNLIQRQKMEQSASLVQ